MTDTTSKTISRRQVAGLAAAAAALAASPALGSNAHMQAALDACQTARHELNQASHNKGGHRVKALDHVDAAIAEIKAGIAVSG